MEENGILKLLSMRHILLISAIPSNPATFELGVNFLRTEIERTEAIGAKQIVLHPGAHVGAGTEVGIKKIIEGLNEVLTGEGTSPNCFGNNGRKRV